MGFLPGCKKKAFLTTTSLAKPGSVGRILAFITDFATARAIRRSLKLPAQQPEPLAHGPPNELELLDQIA